LIGDANEVQTGRNSDPGIRDNVRMTYVRDDFVTLRCNVTTNSSAHKTINQIAFSSCSLSRSTRHLIEMNQMMAGSLERHQW
jgi:hypothetical protein